MKFLFLFSCILSAILISHMTNAYRLAHHLKNADKSIHIVAEGRPIMKHITYWYDAAISQDTTNTEGGYITHNPAPADDDDEEPEDDDEDPGYDDEDPGDDDGGDDYYGDDDGGDDYYGEDGDGDGGDE